MAVIVIERGALRGSVVPIPRERPLIIGREAVCALTLDDPLASRRHSAIGWERGRLWVRDLESSNGTWHNGRRLEAGGAEPLEIGDRLRIGNTLLTVLANTTDANRDALTGRVIAGHELLERLGANEMVTIYRARQRSLGREVAFAVLAPALARQPSVRERFLGQARVAGRLIHPGLIEVYDVGEEGEIAYFTMELLPGKSLEQEVAERGALPPDEVETIAREALEALAYAERHGVVHGQLGPARLRRTREAAIKIAGQGFSPPPGLAALDPYTAPERIGGAEPNALSDLYSLGATLYHLLSGKAPFGAAQLHRLREQIERERPQPLDTLVRDAQPGLLRLIEHLISKRPDQRPASAAEALRMLERREPDERFDAPPAPMHLNQTWRWVIGAVAVLLILALIPRWLRTSAPEHEPISPSVADSTTHTPTQPERSQRMKEAERALAEAEAWLLAHPDSPREAAKRFSALLERYRDLEPIAARAKERRRSLEALAVELEQALAQREATERAARRAIATWERDLASARPEDLSALLARLEQLESEHAAASVITRSAELKAAWKKRALAAIDKVREAVEQANDEQGLAQALAAITRAKSWGLGFWAEHELERLNEELSDKQARLAAQRQAQAREKEEREHAQLVAFEKTLDPDRFAFDEAVATLESLLGKLESENAKSLAKQRLSTLRAEQQAFRALREHVLAGRRPPLTIDLAAGLSGKATEVDDEGVVFVGVSTRGIRVKRRWPQFRAAELEALFLPLPLNARARYGFAHILLDRGFETRARAAFEAAARQAKREGDTLTEREARAALSGKPVGRP